MVIYIDNYNVVLEERWEGGRDILSLSILNIIEEILAQHEIGDAFCIVPDEYGIIFSCLEAFTWREIKAQISGIFYEISKSLGNYLKLQISAGLSRKEKGYRSLPGLYLQANKACRYRFVSGKGKLVQYDEVVLTPNKSDFKQADRVDYLKKILQSMDPEAIRKSISFLGIHETGISIGELDSVRGIYEKYAWIFIDFIEQYGLTQKCEVFLQKYYHYLWNMGSVKELNQWLSEVLAVISGSLSVENQHIKLARQLIHKHFNEAISLTSVADALNVSGGYLSRLFLKELDCNFIDYLNRYRIEKAKEYMKNTGMKIYEIAEKVGYRNVEHFSRLFKKITGKNPREFAGICQQEIGDR